MSMVQLQSQEQSEAEMSNTSIPVSNSCTDSHGPSGYMLKVRKPYTIKKPREKWTEDEHQRFLEALKLYGRGWHRIQEHIGTKTAIQIRSHAQKFFSKVVRESSGSMDSTIQPIEIHPPRSKRKPVHPYPRKPVDILEGMPVSNQFERSTSPKGIPASKQVERSSSPDLVVAEKESQSPTSVLSVVASEPVASALSEQQNGCSSPSSCTSDTNSSLSPIKKEIEHATLSSSSMSIKLFGTTVSVSCCQKPPSHVVEPFLSSTLGCIKGSPDNELRASGSSAYGYLELQCDNGNLIETNTMLPRRILCPPLSMDSSVEEQSEDTSLVERSCAGSAVEPETGECKSHQTSAVGRNSLQKMTRGFVPYKRCTAERNLSSPAVVSEECERQRAPVCS